MPAPDDFPDRRDRLFGREPDIHALIDRARQPGLTALVARPMMGKTWTLHEVARRLVEEGRFVVGYHESKGSETSHLLYAVSNLYARWLADSTMRDQALSLWQRHKETLVPRVGQMVGVLFDKLTAKQLPEGVAATVRSAFDGLAEAQKDLLGGGLQLAPLPYDQAQSLVGLVGKISGRKTVLILDAWEKSPSLRAENEALENLLKHREDWPETHVLVAIRDPQLPGNKAGDEAFRHAENLCAVSASAAIHRLEPTIQDDPKERDRMLAHVRARVTAAQQESDEDLLRWVDGYPGVLDRWTAGTSPASPPSGADLARLAGEAQALRYTDLEQLLGGLQDARLALAARLAFFPRLDAESWKVHKAVLLKDQTEASVDTLVDARVLHDERFPSYGHDTRHAAARRWFIKQKLPLFRRIAEDVIRCLAACITSTDAESRPRFEALVACADAASKAGVDPTVSCLVDAAWTAFGKMDAVLHEQFDRSYPEAVRLTTAVSCLIALSLFNRGVTKGQLGNSDGAMADYTAVIELPGAPIDRVAKALINRGFGKGQLGDNEAETADYTAAIELPSAPADRVAQALVNRGVTKGQIGDSAAALADYTAVIELSDAPVDQVAKALVGRGFTKGELGDRDGAIADYTAAIRLPDAPTAVVELARRALAALSSSPRPNDR